MQPMSDEEAVRNEESALPDAKNARLEASMTSKAQNLSKGQTKRLAFAIWAQAVHGEIWDEFEEMWNREE